LTFPGEGEIRRSGCEEGARGTREAHSDAGSSHLMRLTGRDESGKGLKL
jgi:hypothetical protein